MSREGCPVLIVRVENYNSRIPFRVSSLLTFLKNAVENRGDCSRLAGTS